MTEEPLTQAQEDEALAAEFALGLLTESELQTAQRRMAEDMAFAALVLAWQERLAAMTDGLTPVMAPARAKLAIQRALGHAHEPLSEVPRIRTDRSRRSSRDGGGWLRWLMGAVVAGIVAAALIVIPNLREDRNTAVEYAADLVSAPAGLQITARLAGQELQLELAEGTAAEGRDLELWWIAAEGAAPVSLGVLPRAGRASITLPEGLTPAQGVQLALSDEPQGGSPTGAPTGEVLAIAPLTTM